uniref:RING finger protein 11-like n=1 Tax=Petromyzon marinus TaxID=7757 RepID=A0AAJ7XBF9_PETMA|nr:RING finger protein 11-like [Petromyzon marinus]
MGNCLKAASLDDLSLLHDSEPGDAQAAGPPPPYQQQSVTGYAGDLCLLVVQEEEEAGEALPHSLGSVEEQVRVAQRLGLIQHLPHGLYDDAGPSEKTGRECVICMLEFVSGDAVRYLPCLHTYHVECIDDWLMRSFTCPSCMEPVDAALLSSYGTG